MTAFPITLAALPVRKVTLKENSNSMNSPVVAVEKTADVKLAQGRGTSHMAATHVSQESCPTDCPFYKKGCYAEQHKQGMVTRRLNSFVEDYTPDELAVLEAQAIDRLSGKYPLRLHVVGDSKTNAAAKTVSNAAARYSAKHNKPVYTYTHAWKDVERESWGEVNILASVETAKEANDAYDKGYAVAMVVEHFEKNTAYPLEDTNGLRGVPCLYQTGKVKSCADCGICMNTNKLREKKIVILFAAHGNGNAKKSVRNKLAA